MISISEQNALERALLRFEPFVSNRYGMIEAVKIRPIPAGGPRLFWVEAFAHALRSDSHIKQVGSGIATNLESAICRALGETVERHSAMWHEQSEVLKAVDVLTLRANGKKHMHLHFHKTRRLESQKTDWVRGFYLDDREPVWVPATEAFFGYPGAIDSNSNGLACGRTEEESLAGGLLEVIERDAFAHLWWRKDRWNEVDWRTSQSNEIRELITRLGPWGNSVRLFTPVVSHPRFIDELPPDGEMIFTVFAIYKSENATTDTSFLLAGSASIDVEIACIKAITELALVHLSMQTKMEKIRIQNFDENFDDSIQTFADSVAYYASGKGDRHVEFLLRPKETLRLDGLMRTRTDPKRNSDTFEAIASANLNSALSYSRKLGARPIGIDLTTRDVRKCGFFVHRVLAPELVPLNAAHMWRPAQHPRLKRPYISYLATNEAITEISDDAQTLNSYPHPFP